MELSMDDLRNLLSGQDTTKAEADPAPAETLTTQVTNETPETPAEVPIIENPTHEDKDNNAFAQLRVQNKTMEDALMTMASMLNIKGNDVNDVMTKLQDASLQKRSEESGISKEILARLDAQDRELAEYRQQRQQQQLTQQMIQVRDKYGLDATALQAFARDVDALGVDYSKVNLVDMYQNMNFDKIVQARVDAAVQAALANANSDNGPSNISLGNGAGAAAAEPTIQTAAELEQYLRNARG